MLTIDSYFDKVFYINLDKDTDRNDRMIEQLNKFNISNYKRISATLINEIPDKIYWRNFNVERLTEKYILGAIGARNSHFRIMQESLENNYNKILVLEDDIEILTDPNILLQNNEHILNDWDMIYFGGDEEPHFGGQIVLAHAYAVNRKIIEETFAMLPASGMEVDNFYAKILYHMSYNYRVEGKYLIKKINPFNTMVQNKNFKSNIQH